jgi:hypothetical protein
MNTSSMKTLLRLEELLLTLLTFYLFLQLDYPWWGYLVFFLAPDLSMVGYLAGPRVGALTYNLVHHKGMAVLIYLLGAAFSLPVLQGAGPVMLGHSSMDRIFGYGMKYPDAFQNTHLGRIGNTSRQ